MAKQIMMRDSARTDVEYRKGAHVLTWKGSIQPNQKLARFGESKVKGPWTVVASVSPVLYQLERTRPDGTKQRDVFHTNKMIPYEAYGGPSVPRVHKAPPAISIRPPLRIPGDLGHGSSPRASATQPDASKGEEEQPVAASETTKSETKTEQSGSTKVQRELAKTLKVSSKRAKQREKELKRTYSLPDGQARKRANAKKEIESISEHRVMRGRRGVQYKVRWASGEETWEYARDLGEGVKELDKYRERQKLCVNRCRSQEDEKLELPQLSFQWGMNLDEVASDKIENTNKQDGSRKRATSRD